LDLFEHRIARGKMFLADTSAQPIVRLHLDRMDDKDYRLFGVTAEIASTPKPAYDDRPNPALLVRN
jgi:hypothetical protein